MLGVRVTDKLNRNILRSFRPVIAGLSVIALGVGSASPDMGLPVHSNPVRNVSPPELDLNVTNRVMLGNENLLLELLRRFLAQLTLGNSCSAVIDHLFPVALDLDNFSQHFSFSFYKLFLLPYGAFLSRRTRSSVIRLDDIVAAL
jgi:hypothetical protein